MSKIHVNGVELYYETAGSADNPPLLLITGLAGYTAGWWAQVPALSKSFYVIYYDNRGAGQSTQSPPGYTMTDLADDAAGLLEALKIESAFVFGVSMGGMIAQNLALRHPQKVRKLALGCTTPGGALGVLAAPEVLAELTNTQTSGDRRQDFYNRAWFLVGPGFAERHPDLMAKMADVSANNPQTLMAYMGQLQAVTTHDVGERLGEITMPTLVQHGDQDRLVPPENGRILAERIPDAHLIMYKGAGHLYMIECADAVNKDLQTFFLEEKG